MCLKCFSPRLKYTHEHGLYVFKPPLICIELAKIIDRC
jgi:hypothetical protein